MEAGAFGNAVIKNHDQSHKHGVDQDGKTCSKDIGILKPIGGNKIPDDKTEVAIAKNRPFFPFDRRSSNAMLHYQQWYKTDKQ